jgi:hypothetical protein
MGPPIGINGIDGPFDDTEGTTDPSKLALFMTTPDISLTLTSIQCELNFICGRWQSDGTGLTLDYLYTPTAAVPLPGALPLFATGLGALGLLGWRRKRKAAALSA